MGEVLSLLLQGVEGTLNQIQHQCPGRMMDCGGATAPQGAPLSWGPQTHL